VEAALLDFIRKTIKKQWGQTVFQLYKKAFRVSSFFHKMREKKMLFFKNKKALHLRQKRCREEKSNPPALLCC